MSVISPSLPSDSAAHVREVPRLSRQCTACDEGYERGGKGERCSQCRGHLVIVEGGQEIRAEINRRHWGEAAGGEGDGVSSKEAMLQTLDALEAWGISVETVHHEGAVLEAIPLAVLPITNMCNYCHFKGQACYDRESPLCYNDSRSDGIGVIFARRQNLECSHGENPKK